MSMVRATPRLTAPACHSRESFWTRFTLGHNRGKPAITAVRLPLKCHTSWISLRSDSPCMENR
jgi:hypothetical protein